MRRALVFLVLVACRPAREPVAPSPARARPVVPAEPRTLEDMVGHAAPRFSLPSARDETILTVPSHDVTVVTFFGTWSMGWQVALPTLTELTKKHAGLRVIAVSMDEEKPNEAAERFSPLPMAWSGGMNTSTNREWLSGPYGGENRVFVLDRKGTIRFAHNGGKEMTILQSPAGRQLVESEIERLIAER